MCAARLPVTIRSCYVKPVKMFVFGDHDAEKHNKKNKKTSEGNEHLEPKQLEALSSVLLLMLHDR